MGFALVVAPDSESSKSGFYLKRERNLELTKVEMIAKCQENQWAIKLRCQQGRYLFRCSYGKH